MPQLSTVLHEISVAFGCSTNLRTLTLRLADAMGRHLPVAEVETVRLIAHRDEVGICAYAPGIGRRWDGARSARFLERQGVVAPVFVTDELARVAIAPVAQKLKLPVARTGIVSIAFETDISVILGSKESTDILVDVLALHCLRLGQLSATANRSRIAHHRKVGDRDSPPDRSSSHRKISTEKSVSSDHCERPAAKTAKPNSHTEITVNQRSTEISVETIETALIRCISSALGQARGKIYGPGGAAELLGLKPSTLQSKMRKLGIDRSDFAR